MLKKFEVKIVSNEKDPLTMFSKEYPIRAQLVDAETQKPLNQEVHFRDMGQVRSFYNGWINALNLLGMRGIILSEWGSHGRNATEYEVPVNMAYGDLMAD